MKLCMSGILFPSTASMINSGHDAKSLFDKDLVTVFKRSGRLNKLMTMIPPSIFVSMYHVLNYKVKFKF